MDPNATWAALNRWFNQESERDRSEIEDMIEGLQGWIARGGFLPNGYDAERFARMRKACAEMID